MKIIDLINKMANNEEVPIKIKYRDDYYLKDGIDYYNEDRGNLFGSLFNSGEDFLNDEVGETKDTEAKYELLKEFITNKYNYAIDLVDITTDGIANNASKEYYRGYKDMAREILEYIVQELDK